MVQVCSMLSVPADFKDYIKVAEGTSFWLRRDDGAWTEKVEAEPAESGLQWVHVWNSDSVTNGVLDHLDQSDKAMLSVQNWCPDSRNWDLQEGMVFYFLRVDLSQWFSLDYRTCDPDGKFVWTVNAVGK